MQSNTLANVSLGSALGMVVLFMIQMCIGFIPIVSLIGLVLYPIEWILAFVALITGVLGFRSAASLGGEGKGASIAGVLMSMTWMAFQAVLWVFAFGLVGLMVFMDL